MAEFIVTDPSGKEHVVTAPEGATQDQALEYAKQQFSASQAPTKPSVGPVGSMLDAAASIGSGMIGSAAGGIAGLVAAASPNGAPGVGAEVARQVQDKLTYEPQTSGGEKIAGAVGYLPEKYAAGANWAGERVADKFGPAAGAAVNTAIQAAPMALPLANPRIARVLANERADLAKQKSLNAPRDAGLQAAKDNGLIVPPAQAGAGMALQAIEGLAGEPKTAKLASQKNVQAINDLARKDVGLPEDQPVTRKALAEIRATEGAAYERAKNLGPIKTDAAYFDALDKITEAFDQAATDFQHRSENPFKKTMEGLTNNSDGVSRKTSVDAASLVEEVKLLRRDADKAYATRDPGLGSAFKDAAKALDDLLLRHVQKESMSDPAVASIARDYLRARTRIAKTYDADAALNEATGNINADVYAKRMSGKMTGEGRQIAEFGKQFPRSAQRSERIGSTGPTLWDLAMAGLGKDALLLGARPLTRQALTMRTPSPPSYEGGMTLRMADELSRNPAYGRGFSALGTRTD